MYTGALQSRYVVKPMSEEFTKKSLMAYPLSQTAAAEMLHGGIRTYGLNKNYTKIIMTKSQTKGGGPRRGKKRIRKMGMGSGARVAKAKAQDKKTRG